jgi:hypothetical protein
MINAFEIAQKRDVLKLGWKDFFVGVVFWRIFLCKRD